MADRVKPTHEEWQAQIVDVAKLYGWSHLHIRKSIARGGKWATTTNVSGWPDLFLWHPVRGFAAIECKVKPDKATKEQTAMLAELAGAGARTMVATWEGRPDGRDIDAVVALLRSVNLLANT